MSSIKKVKIITLGCKVNQYESDKIVEQFVSEGYTLCEGEDFDVCIINSCTVTHIADKKTRQMIRRAKKENPHAVVIATGCYVQTNSDDLSNIEEIDILADNTQKDNLPKLLRHFQQEKIIAVGNIFQEVAYSEKVRGIKEQQQTRAFVKIQDGCNNFCSYCKIPFARGKSRSRSINAIEKECAELIKKGYQEIVIIGINLAQYGMDLTPQSNMLEVIRLISQMGKIKRIRIGSIYPEQITDELVYEFIHNEKLVPHIHLSLQSCSNRVLFDMKRSYGVDLINEKIKMLESIKGLKLSADIIVGFPTEDSVAFQESFLWLQESSLASIHVFPYSKREKTQAATLLEKCTPQEIKKRCDELLELSKKKHEHYLKNMVGLTLEILIEKNDCDKIYGYSENYSWVEAPMLQAEKFKTFENMFAVVKIETVIDDRLLGDVIEIKMKK